jgi:hypothetical protein
MQKMPSRFQKDWWPEDAPVAMHVYGLGCAPKRATFEPQIHSTGPRSKE